MSKINKKKLEKIIFFGLIILFVILILGSWAYGFIKKEEPAESPFENCVEKYIFVYEDLCDNSKSFYITYPDMETIKGRLDKVSLEDYPYTVFYERCIQYYKTGCTEDNGKI